MQIQAPTTCSAVGNVRAVRGGTSRAIRPMIASSAAAFAPRAVLHNRSSGPAGPLIVQPVLQIHERMFGESGRAAVVRDVATPDDEDHLRQGVEDCWTPLSAVAVITTLPRTKKLT